MASADGYVSETIEFPLARNLRIPRRDQDTPDQPIAISVPSRRRSLNDAAFEHHRGTENPRDRWERIRGRRTHFEARSGGFDAPRPGSQAGGAPREGRALD